MVRDPEARGNWHPKELDEYLENRQVHAWMALAGEVAKCPGPQASVGFAKCHSPIVTRESDQSVEGMQGKIRTNKFRSWLRMQQASGISVQIMFLNQVMEVETG